MCSFKCRKWPEKNLRIYSKVLAFRFSVSSITFIKFQVRGVPLTFYEIGLTTWTLETLEFAILDKIQTIPEKNMDHISYERQVVVEGLLLLNMLPLNLTF